MLIAENISGVPLLITGPAVTTTSVGPSVGVKVGDLSGRGLDIEAGLRVAIELSFSQAAVIKPRIISPPDIFTSRLCSLSPIIAELLYLKAVNLTESS